MLLELGSTGRIERAAFPDAKQHDAVDDMARSTLRTLHAGLQQSRGGVEPASGEAWETVERDLTGSYRARPQARTASSYEKRKVVESARAEELAGQSLSGLITEVEQLEAAGATAERSRAYSNLAA